MDSDLIIVGILAGIAIISFFFLIRKLKQIHARAEERERLEKELKNQQEKYRTRSSSYISPIPTRSVSTIDEIKHNTRKQYDDDYVVSGIATMAVLSTVTESTPTSYISEPKVETGGSFGGGGSTSTWETTSSDSGSSSGSSSDD